MIETEIVERKELIALKIPDTPDSWKFLDNRVVDSLTEAYEVYFQGTGVKAFHFDASEVPAKIYAVHTDEVEIKKEPVKTYSLYGDYSQSNES